MTLYVAIRSGMKAGPEESLLHLTHDLLESSGIVQDTDYAITQQSPLARAVNVASGRSYYKKSVVTYHGRSTATESINLTANTSGNPRIDAIVAWIDLSVNLSAIDDSTGEENVHKITPVQGTPSSSPTAPSSVAIETAIGSNNPYIVLAHVMVANGASQITNSDITDTRTQAKFIFPKKTERTGIIEIYGGDVAPHGYLLCNGSTVSRSTYAGLFSVLGTRYGPGDGSTTFNLPDLRGRTIAGYNSADADFDAIGKTGGAKTHTLTTGQLPTHSHGVTDPGHNHAITDPGHNHTYYKGYLSGIRGASGSGTMDVEGNADTGSKTTGITINNKVTSITIQNAGSGQAHNNLQPYITLNYIIKT